MVKGMAKDMAKDMVVISRRVAKVQATINSSHMVTAHRLLGKSTANHINKVHHISRIRHTNKVRQTIVSHTTHILLSSMISTTRVIPPSSMVVIIMISVVNRPIHHLMVNSVTSKTKRPTLSSNSVRQGLKVQPQVTPVNEVSSVLW